MIVPFDISGIFMDVHPMPLYNNIVHVTGPSEFVGFGKGHIYNNDKLVLKGNYS